MNILILIGLDDIRIEEYAEYKFQYNNGALTILNYAEDNPNEVVAAIKLVLEKLRASVDKIDLIFTNKDRKLIAAVLENLSIKTLDIKNRQLVISINIDDSYADNVFSQKQKADLISRAKKAAKKMRTDYYLFSANLENNRERPLYGVIKNEMPTSSLGPFPEIIISTYPCEKTMKGFCLPCFFSKVPMSKGDKECVMATFSAQIDYVIAHFDELVINYQKREYHAKPYSEDILLCLACNGSFFSNTESMSSKRVEALSKICNEVEKRNLKARLLLETCVDDYLRFIVSDEFSQSYEYLKKLNTTILFGFESINSFTRDALYVKDMSLDDFEKAYNFNVKHGIGTGAFLYTGYFAMSENERVIDFAETLCYITQRDILPVLMFSNAQKYTIPYMLYVNKKFNMMDPLTGLKLFKLLLWFTEDKQAEQDDVWLTGEVCGGPPLPDINLFNNHYKICCDDCAHSIMEAIQKTRKTHNIESLKVLEMELANCPNGCLEKYERALEVDNLSRKVPLYERVKNCIDFVSENIDVFLFHENISLLKKQLLCYGLKVDDETRQIIGRINKTLGQNKNVHVAQIMLPNGEYVNADTGEGYTIKSQFSLRFEDEQFWIFKNNRKLCEAKIQPLPEWVSRKVGKNNRAIDFIIPHGDDVLAFSVHRPCHFKKIGKSCKFCTSDSVFSSISEEEYFDTLFKVLKIAFAHNKNYALALSGGTTDSADRGAAYFEKIIDLTHKINPSVKISVELAPPEQNIYLESLFKKGVNSIIMNLEIYDEEIRNQICPGKSIISRDRYFEALQYAVKLFGIGNVGSVLIAGLEPIESTIIGARRMIDMGVIPTIMPFRPYDNCLLSNKQPTDVDSLITIERDLSWYKSHKGVMFKYGPGCLTCNACIGVNLSDDGIK